MVEYLSAAGIPLAKTVELQMMNGPKLELDLSTHYCRDGTSVMYPGLDNKELVAIREAVRHLGFSCEHYQYWLEKLSIGPKKETIHIAVNGRMTLSTRRESVFLESMHEFHLNTSFELPRGMTTQLMLSEIKSIGAQAEVEMRTMVMGARFMAEPFVETASA